MPGYVLFFPFSFVSVWTKETNLSPLLVLKDTRYSVTSIIKLLQRQTLRAAGNNRLGKCFEFFMKHTWYWASDGVRVTVFCSCRDNFTRDATLKRVLYMAYLLYGWLLYPDYSMATLTWFKKDKKHVDTPQNYFISTPKLRTVQWKSWIVDKTGIIMVLWWGLLQASSFTLSMINFEVAFETDQDKDTFSLKIHQTLISWQLMIIYSFFSFCLSHCSDGFLIVSCVKKYIFCKRLRPVFIYQRIKVDWGIREKSCFTISLWK